MHAYRFLLLLVTSLVLAGQPLHAQDKGKERKAKKKKAKTEQPAGADHVINDGEPTISRRDLETAESMFVEGLKFSMLEDYPRALDYYQKSYAINPRNAGVLYKLSETYLAMGKLQEAEPFAKKALELDGKNRYYYITLGQIYASQQRYDEAIKVYNKLLKEVPNTEEYTFNLAELYVAQGKLDDALKTYERLEKAVGVHDEIVLKKQQIYLKQNNLDKAMAEGQKLVQANPDEPRYLLMQAELLYNNNRKDQALELLNKALKNSPDNPYAQLMLAEMLKQQGKTTEANTHLKAAFESPALDIDAKVRVLVDYIRLLPNPEAQQAALQLAEITVRRHPQDAKAYAVAGDIQALSQQKVEARNNYLKAVKLDQSHFQIWQQIIMLDAELQQNDSLVVHTEKALEIFPNQGLFWFYNGTAYLLKGNHQKAVRALEQGKKLSSDNPELLLQINSQLGDAYNSLKDYPKSDAAYEEALTFDSNNPHVLNNYSYFLSLRNDRLEKAKSMSQKLVKQFPSDPTYLDTHAWVLYKMKDYQGAKHYLELAVSQTTDATVVEHYGDVLYQLGQADQALEQWKKAKQKGGASDLIDKKIKDRKLYE